MSIEDFCYTLRNVLYSEEGKAERIIKRKLSKYLRENKDNYKHKYIKKLYQYYTILYQIKSLIFHKSTFDEMEIDTSLHDFYCFLLYVIDCTKDDIITFIDIMQDKNFDNEEIIRKQDVGKQLHFNIYTVFKHFRE